MHKITKGLKKKKKGKKSKHKEEELFKPEELEAYRREHQQVSDSGEIIESTTVTENEEWKKFNALTAGIDTVLKKTQGDLNRIKSTSFFQRVPPSSEIKQKEEEERALETASAQKLEESQKAVAPESAIVLVSESESEGEDEDDIFDTTYIDVIASGEVKLVHIPDSPQKEAEGDDPFDTSIAERAILGPSVDRKGKKLVPIGSAVEILTGRVQAPTCAPIKRPNTRRYIEEGKSLLLQSFDENSNTTNEAATKAGLPLENKVTLLDDNAPSELLNTPIDLSRSLHLSLATTPINLQEEQVEDKVVVQQEFGSVAANLGDDDDDDEFSQLAVESLAKKAPSKGTIPVSSQKSTAFGVEDSWCAFEGEKSDNHIEEDFAANEDVDPFDTTFAENILPGKAELKIIENEILNGTENFNFQTETDTKHKILQEVNIQVTNANAQQKSAERISENELNLIQPIHRDLLGGSSTDLSSLGDQPLKPKEVADKDYIEYCDPFDTSIVETAKLPGQTELKFLERELLGEYKDSLGDQDFDSRADESSNKHQFRKVSFDLPLEQQNLLVIAKPIKPLTPYYTRENSIPEVEESVDPFDTSFVSEVAPGKSELKLIESELFEKQSDSLLDPNFDPRDENQVAVAKVIQSIQELANPDIKNTKPASLSLSELLVADNDVNAKVLTPAIDKSDFDIYSDPFDTSIASNILPGKTELKLLESELINSVEVPLQVHNFPTTIAQSRSTEKNFFEEQHTSDVNVKPLIPVLDSDTVDDIDPFDTSIACNIGLGKTELKLLESELI